MSQANISTPERKKEYVKQWLEKNPLPDSCSTVNSNEFTPDVSFVSSSQYQKQLVPGTPPRSPAVSEKRSASSPVFGGQRRSLKRMKIVPKIAKFDDEKPSCSKVILKENCAMDIDLDKDHDPHYLEKTEVSEVQDTFNISSASKYDKYNIFQTKPVEPYSTQYIESVSSDHNTDNTDLGVQEAASDTDKTASDLVEEISSQLIIESPQKAKQTFLSQKISTPSTSSSEKTSHDHIIESHSNTRDQTDPQIIEVCTPADQIDTVSTTESRRESSKISFILHYKDEKTLKKKKSKKGSLSELLQTTIGNERSSVTLSRHQLNKNSPDTAGIPFVLLQILHHLPNFNGNQFLQCILLEDTANLMKDLVKIKTKTITVMNVPEISSTINMKQKPVLKVYQPWTVLEPNQLLIHITRFIAIPSTKENLDFKTVDKKVLRLVQEFHCPCIENNALSKECKSQFCDTGRDSINMICNYDDDDV